MNKFERLETTILLSKIRNILLTERIKGYYRNEMNITEILSNPIRIQVMQYLQTYVEMC